MERIYSPKNKYDDDDEAAGLQSCWGWLKLFKLPWRRKPRIWRATTRRHKVEQRREEEEEEGSVCFNKIGEAFRRRRRRAKNPKPAGGGFKYDPLSYSQNFDEGCWGDEGDVDSMSRGFSSRYAAPSSSTSKSLL